MSLGRTPGCPAPRKRYAVAGQWFQAHGGRWATKNLVPAREKPPAAGIPPFPPTARRFQRPRSREAVVPFFCMLAGMGKLTSAEVQAEMQGVEGWTLEGDAIRRKFTLPSFADAIAFVARLAFDAEAADHHPE